METSWNKINHAKSSMASKPNQFALFIGRWQPLHDGHKELFQQALNEGKNVCIAIRDGEVNENNPFAPLEVKANISEFYKKEIKEGKIKVILVPDICSVEFGRGVGYDVIEHVPPTSIASISATKIRYEMINNK
jgi:nicotinamide mononucleotide adenylyltransferase